jgi:hypothetical protein
MTFSRISRGAMIVLLAGASLTACKKKTDVAPMDTSATVSTTQAPASIADLVTCREVTSDLQPVGATASFHPTDTIRAIVRIENAASTDKAGVKWYYVKTNQVVREDVATVAHAGSVSTPFMISKPDGFPEGDYRVEGSLNGTVGKTANFTVAK